MAPEMRMIMQNKIPDIDLIDLDSTDLAALDSVDTGTGNADTGSENADLQSTDNMNIDNNDANDTDTEDADNQDTDTKDADAGDKPRKIKFRLNTHIVLIAIIVLTVAVIVIKFSNWGQFIDPSTNSGDSDDYQAENYDSILPLTDESGDLIAPDLSDGLSIAVFGNTPFADDRDSKEGLAGLLADMADATVYNFSIGGSYLASTQAHPYTDVNPWDALTFYWMAYLTTDIEVDDYVGQALDVMGDSAPPELAEVHSLYSTVDFDTVDIIVVMYDATDYLMGHSIYNPDNPTDIQTFLGNLTAGLELLQKNHPNTRIIVMSPPYAYSADKDENGNYISSDIVKYNSNALSEFAVQEAYICSLMQISFVDNIYNTFNENNARDYLTDNLHLNAAGRRRIAERLVDAINYYNSFYE